MVKAVEIKDEEKRIVVDNDDGFVTDSGSEGSASEDEQLVEDDDELVMTAFDPSQETYAERFYALKDMISPSTRATLSTLSSSAGTWGKYGVNLAGSGAWVVITSAILLGLPLALAVEGETMFVQQEKMEREQLQGQQMMLPQGQSGNEKGVVPPGF